MPSPSQMMALQKLVNASAALEVQFDQDASRRPVLFLLKKAREAAVAAMDALIFIDPTKADDVRQLQHEIRRYDDLVAWCREIIGEGKEADRLIVESERMEFARAVLDPENADDLEAAGFNPEDLHDDR